MGTLSICHALIHLNERTTVWRGHSNPVNYAEIELMRFTIGERAIDKIVVVEEIEATNQEVLEQLRLTYGDAVKEAFPGTRPRLPMHAPEDVPRVNLSDLPPNEYIDPEPVENTGDEQSTEAVEKPPEDKPKAEIPGVKPKNAPRKRGPGRPRKTEAA